jgi:hypothetical protein
MIPYADQTMARYTYPARVAPHLVTLITMLQRTNPTWEFVCRDWGMQYTDQDGQTAIRYDSFSVLVDDELIGLIETEFWRGANTYAIDCKALRNKRERGSRTFAKCPKKAASIIAKNFAAPTHAEIISQAAGLISAASSELATSAQRKLGRAREKVQDAMSTFAMANMDMFLDYTGVGKEHVHEFIVADSENEDATHLRSVVSNKQYSIVQEKGTSLITANCAGDIVVVHSPTQLPEHMKAGYSLLKLAKAGEHIPGVGMRNGEHIYMIMETGA